MPEPAGPHQPVILVDEVTGLPRDEGGPEFGQIGVDVPEGQAAGGTEIVAPPSAAGAEVAQTQFRSPIFDPSVPGPPVIDPNLFPQDPRENPLARVDPSVGRVGGKFGAMFSLQALRETLGTDRHIYEWKRMRSLSPCRSCQHGTEIFGVAELQTQTYTGLARRVLCARFEADVTNNAIVHCDGYERDDLKLAKPPIHDLERALRERFKLTAPPPDPYSEEEIHEEVAMIASATGRPVPPPIVPAGPLNGSGAGAAAGGSGGSRIW